MPKEIKIAIVDDSDASRFMTKTFLERSKLAQIGLEINQFAYPEDLLEPASLMDIIILDHSFGEGRYTGIQMLPVLKRRFPHAIIIGLSAHQNFLEKFILAGANNVVLKRELRLLPIVIANLLASG
ncbi:MAG: response regulator [Candidatus Woesebacteria bacterium]|jgi:DNA-binding NarL/FixJ family response regulator